MNMNMNKVIISLCVLMYMAGMCGCFSQKEKKGGESVADSAVGSSITAVASETPIESTVSSTVSEDNTIYACGISDRLKSYETVDELVSASENVFYGKVISSTSYFQNETLYTVSDVEVMKVYMGNFEEGDIVHVGEDGGRTTVGEYAEQCNIETKAFEPLPDHPIDLDTPFVQGTDGYYPMKEGEKLLLFVNPADWNIEGATEPLFFISGGYDGKLHETTEGVYMKPFPGDSDKYDEESYKDGGVLTITEEDLVAEVSKNKS